jgi:hypothetical protein
MLSPPEPVSGPIVIIDGGNRAADIRTGGS